MKASELADKLGGELIGNRDAEVSAIADLDDAVEGDLAFSAKNLPVDTRASCVLISDDADAAGVATAIRVPDPKLAFAKAAALVYPRTPSVGSIAESARVALTARVATDVSLGEFVTVGEESSIDDGTRVSAGCRIGNGVSIGAECELHANVVIEDGCTIGDRVILHAGVVVGADGFGFVRDGAHGYVKFPQRGSVIVEDDVEIGANSCIDRGALGDTRIGAGTKIDNLVQIAHNVEIGSRVVIAAQTGISGSTVIEDDCVIGGQVGMGDHARVKSGAVIGSQAGVLPGKIVRPGVWWGTPVQPLDEYKRQNALVKGLARMKEEIRQLREKLNGNSED